MNTDACDTHACVIGAASLWAEEGGVRQPSRTVPNPRSHSPARHGLYEHGLVWPQEHVNQNTAGKPGGRQESISFLRLTSNPASRGTFTDSRIGA
jgi:hypothetical protein